jgi:hypothetical protein
VAHLYFFATAQTNAKKSKRATKQLHHDTANMEGHHTTETEAHTPNI